MSSVGLFLSQVAVEYGVVGARGAFVDAQRFLSSVGPEVWLTVGAVLVGLYLLVKWS